MLVEEEAPREQGQGILVFFSYSHRDKVLRDKLEEHLSILKYRGLISTWHDREIQAGQEWSQQIDIHLNNAHIILLLISSSFMASGYCYGIEMKRALERHEQKDADVVPILLRPVLYTGAPFEKLQMLPTNGRPVVKWRLTDDAFCDIARSIEKIARKYSLPPSLQPSQPLPQTPLTPFQPPSAPYSQPPSIPYSQPPSAPYSQQSSPYGAERLQPLIRNKARYRLSRRATAFILGPVAVLVVLLSIIYSLSFIFRSPSSSSSVTPPASISHILSPLIISGILILLLLIVVTAVILIVRGFVRAKTRRRNQYYEKAVEVYQRALLRHPYDGYAFQGMGKALSALRRYDKALDAFRQAIEHLPASDKTAVSAAYAGMGGALARLKRHNEAVTAYERAMALDSTVTFNHNDLMRALLALGRKEEAARIRERARQPERADI